MKKKMIMLALCFMCVSLVSCGNENNDDQQTSSSSVAQIEQAAGTTEETQPSQAETSLPETTEESQPDTTDEIQPDTTEESIPEETVPAQSDEPEDTPAAQNESSTDAVTEIQALDAIKHYCFINNPDLKNMSESDEYTIYWDVNTNESGQIVVMYRSYTGAQIRYYIDPVTGETYSTELVPGIIDEEQRTDESFNVREYLE